MRERMKKNKKGSALVAVLLTMFMIAIISLSVISRTQRLLNVSIESKKSQVGYQTSDQNVERLFNQFKKYDVDTTATTLKAGKLLQKVSINDFMTSLYTSCNATNPTIDPVACNVYNLWNTNQTISKLHFYNGVSTTPMQGTDLIKDVQKLSINSDNTSLQVRAVSAPLPARISVPSGSVTQCSDVSPCGGNNMNTCKYRVDISYDAKISSKIILKSTIDTAGTSGWVEESEITPVAAGNSEIIFQGTNYGEPKWLAVKAKNSNNYAFDSLDVLTTGTNPLTFPAKFTPPGGYCIPGGATPPNMELCKAKSSCCEATECYQCLLNTFIVDGARPWAGCAGPQGNYEWTWTNKGASNECKNLNTCSGACGPGTYDNVHCIDKATGSQVIDDYCVADGRGVKPSYCFDTSCQWTKTAPTVSGCTQTIESHCMKGGTKYSDTSNVCCMGSKPSDEITANICSNFFWGKNSCTAQCVYDGHLGEYQTCYGRPNGSGNPVIVNNSNCASLPKTCSCNSTSADPTADCTVDENCKNMSGGVQGFCKNPNDNNLGVCKFPDGSACTTSGNAGQCASGKCCMGECIGAFQGCVFESSNIDLKGQGCFGGNENTSGVFSSIVASFGTCYIKDNSPCRTFAGAVTDWCGSAPADSNSGCLSKVTCGTGYCLPSNQGNNADCQCDNQCDGANWCKSPADGIGGKHCCWNDQTVCEDTCRSPAWFNQGSLDNRENYNCGSCGNDCTADYGYTNGVCRTSASGSTCCDYSCGTRSNFPCGQTYNGCGEYPIPGCSVGTYCGTAGDTCESGSWGYKCCNKTCAASSAYSCGTAYQNGCGQACGTGTYCASGTCGQDGWGIWGCR